MKTTETNLQQQQQNRREGTERLQLILLAKYFALESAFVKT